MIEQHREGGRGERNHAIPSLRPYEPASFQPLITHSRMHAFPSQACNVFS